ncbi:MAG: rhombosortase [Candidatus Didemnitutus sp.]|nr:rhombosortase [Candidatus Didemnitutus sp.]
MKTLRSPLALFALPALAAALAPAWFIYDRAAISAGQWWRVATGHWVHFSASHAAWNLLVLLVAGAWLERTRPGVLLRYTVLAAPAIGLGLFALAPTMAIYGGLSGLAVGIVLLLALTQLATAPAARAWWLAALTLVVAKLVWESQGGAALFSDFGSTAIRPSVAAHVLGAAAALAYHLASRTPAFLPSPRTFAS